VIACDCWMNSRVYGSGGSTRHKQRTQVVFTVRGRRCCNCSDRIGFKCKGLRKNGGRDADALLNIVRLREFALVKERCRRLRIASARYTFAVTTLTNAGMTLAETLG